MTNEELAARIRAGEKELIPDLWKQTKAYLYKICLTTYRKSMYRCIVTGVTLEDMKQLAYIALCSAVKAYDPEKGFLFVSYAKMHLRNEINAALRLYKKEDPLNMCVSLDTPIDEEDELTIGDMLADQSADDNLRDVEDQLFIQELHNDLEDCLDSLPQSEEKAIREKYYNNQQTDKNGEIRALRKLRKPENVHKLQGYAAELFAGQCYLRTGEKAFKQDAASSPERMAEMMERWRKKHYGNLGKM